MHKEYQNRGAQIAQECAQAKSHLGTGFHIYLKQIITNNTKNDA